MLDTMGMSGYMQAVKLRPRPARKNANRLAFRVSQESLKRLLSGALAGAGAPPPSASLMPLLGAVKRAEGFSAGAFTWYSPGAVMSNTVSLGG